MQSTELSIQEMERCKLETEIVGFEIGKTASTNTFIKDSYKMSHVTP